MPLHTVKPTVMYTAQLHPVEMEHIAHHSEHVRALMRLDTQEICTICLQGFELVFYGDSITETWRGTDMGRPCSRCTGVPAIFQKYFGSKYDSEVLAVGGTASTHFPVRNMCLLLSMLHLWCLLCPK